MRVMRISAVRMENGMLDPTIREAFRSPKNSQMTTMEMMTASTRVCSTDFKESRICSALSRTTRILVSGSVFFRVSITAFASLESSTAVAFCCFVMETETVGFPL